MTDFPAGEEFSAPPGPPRKEVSVISPDQVDRLQDQLDTFTTVSIVGGLFFVIGGTLGIFASQEFANGTDFMMRLAGAQQGFGALLIVVGWVKIRAIKAELNRHVPPEIASQANAAGAGH